MITYLLQVAICWALFLGLYHATLRKETFFMVNRTYLLLTLVLGLVIPRLTWDTSMFMVEPAIETAIFFMTDGFQLFQEVVEPQNGPMTWLGIVYWIGVIIMFAKLFWGIGKIIRIYQNADIQTLNNQKIAYTQTDHAPFTFFGTIYLSTLRNDENENKEILIHESAHVSGWHTADVLFVELIKVFFWFNPLAYSYDHALKTVHEYIADANVLRRTALQKYGRLLLRQAQPGLEIALVNHFYNTQLKKRFKMMTRTPSQKRMLLKYLSVLPFILVVSLVFTNQKVQAEIGKVEEINLEGLLNTAKTDIKDLVFRYANSTETDGWRKYAEINDDLHELLKYKTIYEKVKLPKQINDYAFALKTDLTSKWDDGRFAIGFNEGDGTVFLYPENKIKLNLDSPFLSVSGSSPTVTYNGPINWTADSIIFHEGQDIHLVGNVSAHTIQSPLAQVDTLPYLDQIDTVITYDPETFKEEIKIVRTSKSSTFNELNKKISSGLKPRYIIHDHNGNQLPIGNKLIHPIKKMPLDAKDILSISFVQDDPKGNQTYPTVDKDGGYLIYLKEPSTLYKTSEIYMEAEEMPEFPGGQEAMFQYIFKNLKYPKTARKNNVQGMALVTFIVEVDGSISRPELLRDPGTGIGEEALRVVNQMAQEYKWKPGKQRGKEVRVQFKLPLKFALSDDFVPEPEEIVETIQEGKPIQDVNGHWVKIDTVTTFYPERFEEEIKIVRTEMPADYTSNPVADNSEIFKVVEVMPEFPGGQPKLLEYVFKNLKYPTIARENSVEGMAVISFVVEKDGSISDSKILRDPGAGLGAEAQRVVNQMGTEIKWKPGVQRGQKVRVQYNLPVRFKLDESAKNTQAENNPLIVVYDKNEKELYKVKKDNVKEAFLNIDPKQIKHINVVKGKKATDLFGQAGVHGVVQIYLKKASKKILSSTSISVAEEPDTVPNKSQELNNAPQAEMNFQSLSLQPNPVTNELIVDLKGITTSTSILISSIEGKELYRDVILQTNNADPQDLRTTHDISQLNSGILVVSIIQGDKVYSQPVVKK